MLTKIYICPSCKARYFKRIDAQNCKNQHLIYEQEWLMCKCGWGVRSDCNSNAKFEFDRHIEKHTT